MRENNFLESDVDLDDLAERTKNYSGAEIEGLVKSAASYAFDRQIDASNPTKPVDPSKVRVTRSDFYNVRLSPSPKGDASVARTHARTLANLRPLILLWRLFWSSR